MILGALVALGVDREKLIEQIKLLDIADFDIEFSKKLINLEFPRFTPKLKFRTNKRIAICTTSKKSSMIRGLSEKIKKRAIEIFTNLAKAEAKIHGIDVEKVHFHEVGAMDAIIDVVGACIGFEMLGIEKFACSKIHVGSGFVKMAHGKFPVPPPAVAELLKGYSDLFDRNRRRTNHADRRGDYCNGLRRIRKHSRNERRKNRLRRGNTRI